MCCSATTASPSTSDQHQRRAPTSRSAETSPPELTRLGEGVQNAVVLADSKGDVAQAAKVLQVAIKRASADDPAHSEARSFLTELSERLPEG